MNRLMTKIKPCLHCKGEGMLESFKVRKGYEAAIHCSNCLAIMNTITYDNEEDAIEACIKAWNRRDGE